MSSMMQIDSNTIGNAAPVLDWVNAMEDALRDVAEGRVHVPPRNHIDRGPNTLLLMPCFGEKYFSTKLVSEFPNEILTDVKKGTQFFKSVGMAAFDLYGARLVYENMTQRES